MQDLYLCDMWLQQGDARCHTARLTMDLLRGEFDGHFISQSEPAIKNLSTIALQGLSLDDFDIKRNPLKINKTFKIRNMQILMYVGSKIL